MVNILIILVLIFSSFSSGIYLMQKYAKTKNQSLFSVGLIAILIASLLTLLLILAFFDY